MYSEILALSGSKGISHDLDEMNFVVLKENMMTNLLEQAFHKIEQLPKERRNAIVARLLADLADEEQWAEQFADATDAQWDKMAAMARKEIADGSVTPLDDIFPTRSSKR